MATPLIDAPERLTPEKRERIHRILEQRLDEPEYRLLTPAHLKALANLRASGAPIVSVYLRLTPERRERRAWAIVYKDLAKACLARIEDRRMRQAVADELARVEQAAAERLPELGRGAAFFVCEPLGLWRQITLPVALDDRVVADSRPCIRPLVSTRDEHDRFVIALLSQERSRFFISQIGVVDEVLDVKGERLRGLVTDWIPPQERERIERHMVQAEVKALAQIAALVCAQFAARYLLLAGSPRLRAALVQELPKPVQFRFGGDFDVELQARASEVAAAAAPLQHRIEAREETMTVDRLRDAVPHGGVLGLDDTIDALNQRRAMKLVVDEEYRAAGGQCPRCRMLASHAQPNCPACGAVLVGVDDFVDLALERALDQGAAIEIVRSAQARAWLRELAPIGALTRF
ncbi:MAG TPA: hypothetical protein VNM24_03290 [Burkholderiales bacterium]|jgi:peptide subunit release factor 1 (eRF1)|nr:hypothetical protein [Burkholderiales bacterium]